MSIERCSRCSDPVDTDVDDECYVQVSPEDVEPFCERCREQREAEQEAEMLAAKRAYDAAPLSERDPDAYRQSLIDAGRGHLLRPEER